MIFGLRHLTSQIAVSLHGLTARNFRRSAIACSLIVFSSPSGMKDTPVLFKVSI